MSAPFGLTCVGGRGPMTFSRRTRGAFTPASLPSFVSGYQTDTDVYKESVGLTLPCGIDSLTFGTGSSTGMDYPTQLAGLLSANLSVPQVAINKGTPARTIATARTDATTDFDAQLSAPNQKRYFVLLGGTNDYIAGTSAATVVSDQTGFCSDRITAGFDGGLLCTIPPSSLITGGNETHRTDGNAALRLLYPTATAFPFIFTDGSGTILLIDLAAVPSLQVPGADGTHFVDAQYTIIAVLFGHGLNLLGVGNAPTGATAGNDTVGQWYDLSRTHSYGSEEDARSPLLKKAVQNGRDMILFDGPNDLYKVATPYSLGTKFTLYVIIRPAAAAVGVVFFKAPGFPILLDATNLTSRLSDSTDVTIAHGGLSISTIYLLCLRRDDTLFQLFVNSVQQGGDQTAGSNAASGISDVGEYVIDAATMILPMSAHVGDHWIFNDAHSPTDRASVETYLQALWAY